MLFTAPKSNRILINKMSRNLKIRITRIGKILNKVHRSAILNEKNKKIILKNKGYFHKF